MPPRKRNRNTSAIEKNEDLVEVKGNKKRIYLTDFDKQGEHQV